MLSRLFSKNKQKLNKETNPYKDISNQVNDCICSTVTNNVQECCIQKLDDPNTLNSSMDLLRSTVFDLIDTATSTAISVSEELKIVEHRLFSIIDAIPDIIIIKGPSNRWLTINKAAQILFNFHSYEYIGKTNEELLRDHPELISFESFRLNQNDDEETWESKTSLRTFDVLCSDENEQYFDVIKTPTFHENGERKELIVIARDITLQILEQQKTRACFLALNASSDGIIILDRNEKIFFVNFTFQHMFSQVKNIKYEGIHVCDVIKDFIGKDKKETRRLLKNTQTWKTFWKDYDITVLPIMNGVPEPIFNIISFKSFRK
jgi:PAS domain S-box-containing protein